MTPGAAQEVLVEHRLAVRHTLILRAALASARIQRDPNGNPRRSPPASRGIAERTPEPACHGLV